MFKVSGRTGKVLRPDGIPDILLPDYNNKDINVDDKLHRLEVWKHYFNDTRDNSQYKMWKERLQKYQKWTSNERALVAQT